LTLVGGIALGAIVGGELWTYFGKPATVAGVRLISPAFSLNAVLYLLSLAVFAWGLRDFRRRSTSGGPSKNNNGRFEHYRRLLKSRTVWLFIPAWLAIFSIVGMWINNSGRLLTDERHHFRGQLLTGTITTDHYGNGQAALAVFFAAGLLAWSLVLGRYRKTSVMLTATFGLFALLFTVFGLNHIESSRTFLHYLLLGSLLIELLVLSGFTPAALTYLADVTERYAEDRGSIMGLYSVFLGVGQLLGTTLGGYFAQWHGIDGMLLLSAIFGAVTAASLLLLRRGEQRPAVTTAPRLE
jgi:predicted MFS family arabinose efflux permease